MTNVAPLHQMTLAEAEAALEAINYDPDWTREELLAAVAHLPRADVHKISDALHITATALTQEANELEAYRSRKFGAK